MSEVDVPMTFGALLIGGIIAIMFSGVTIAQCVIFLKLFPRETIWMKLMVFAVWLLDMLHSIFISMSLWNYLIVHFGNHAGIDIVPTSLALTIVATAILTFGVHCFFIYRIFVLAKNNYFITVPILLIAAARLCFACLTTSKLIEFRSLEVFVALFTWSFTTGLTLSAVVDVLITGLMCYLLRARRKQYSSMNKVLDTLILYAFENGFLTTLAALLSLITWLTMKHNLIFLATHFIIIKFYANSLLATLNARKQLQGGKITMHTTNLATATTLGTVSTNFPTHNSKPHGRALSQSIVFGPNSFSGVQGPDSREKADFELESVSGAEELQDLSQDNRLRIKVDRTHVRVTDGEPRSPA
ncbi:hypothetical protein CC1G_08413 [Coprinopsis cinerea okayama7|uniref:DUF6534 domain-containing protein n=1 Tax=Coprinopsis cinerea (strain Okayama-7 / 130 / ATCC MYA-4618 / FGSC 9003) TaxID=240176 RepID=A8NAP4_COPC7|nr:hypothetical protein CC1G_08413 [Coprinopsis cinerea okayama7\|eukprot:XP_001831896.1 hypothetical protein CC1G_08413 [Coprinopsis cinerea okayama7\